MSSKCLCQILNIWILDFESHWCERKGKDQLCRVNIVCLSQLSPKQKIKQQYRMVRMVVWQTAVSVNTSSLPPSFSAQKEQLHYLGRTSFKDWMSQHWQAWVLFQNRKQSERGIMGKKKKKSVSVLQRESLILRCEYFQAFCLLASINCGMWRREGETLPCSSQKWLFHRQSRSVFGHRESTDITLIGILIRRFTGENSLLGIQRLHLFIRQSMERLFSRLLLF